MLIQEICTRLHCSENTVRLLQQKGLLPNPVTLGSIERFCKSSSLLGQLSKARRESVEIDEEEARQQVAREHERAELLRRLSKAKSEGNFEGALQIHEELIEAESNG